MTYKPRVTLEDVPQILLEQAVMGELPAIQQLSIESLPGFAEYCQSLQAENEAILDRYPISDNLGHIRQKNLAAVTPTIPENRPKKILTFARVSAIAVPIAATALFVFAVLRPGQDLAGNDATPDINRIKGTVSSQAVLVDVSRSARNAAEQLMISVRSAKDLVRTMLSAQPQLEIWRQRDGKAEVLKPGARVKAFESLQIAYLAAGKSYGMIVSLDGRGRFTLHYPESFDTRPVLDQGNPSVLDFAYQLDDAPRFERFFFITSNDDFLVHAIWSLLEKQLGGNDLAAVGVIDAEPDLPAGFEVASFLLNK